MMKNKDIIKILRDYFIGRGWYNLKNFEDGYFYEKNGFIEIYVFFCNYENKYRKNIVEWVKSDGDEFNKYIKFFLEHVNIALSPHKKELNNQILIFNFRHNKHHKKVDFHPFCDINQI